MLTENGSYKLLALGLRLLNLTREQEDGLLDHFIVTPILGDRPYGERPGSLLSTMRHTLEDETVDPDNALLTTPGYILLMPIIVPVRMQFWVDVEVKAPLPRTVSARVLTFGCSVRGVY
jgi:hypothetical protein